MENDSCALKGEFVRWVRNILLFENRVRWAYLDIGVV